jgi:hypothetical protein
MLNSAPVNMDLQVFLLYNGLTLLYVNTKEWYSWSKWNLFFLFLEGFLYEFP